MAPHLRSAAHFGQLPGERPDVQPAGRGAVRHRRGAGRAVATAATAQLPWLAHSRDDAEHNPAGYAV